jgi:hypothetical protein
MLQQSEKISIRQGMYDRPAELQSCDFEDREKYSPSREQARVEVQHRACLVSVFSFSVVFPPCFSRSLHYFLHAIENSMNCQMISEHVYQRVLCLNLTTSLLDAIDFTSLSLNALASLTAWAFL